MFNWDDNNVIDFITSLGVENDILTMHNLMREFKNSKCSVPENMTVKYNNINQVIVVEKDGEVFSIGDSVYDSKEMKKYGGKKNSYLLTIDTMKMIYTHDNSGLILTATVKINDFYDLNNLSH